MKITEYIHAIKIPFSIPIAPDKSLERFVYVYLILGEKITLVDSGVAGSSPIVFDYIVKQGRNPKEITTLILTHSHPDHIGGAVTVQKDTGCSIFSHQAEKNWIEDTALQFKERPVPGFHNLVEGSVSIDRFLADGKTIDLGTGIQCEIIHTPGHSKGSISLLFKNEKAIITGDALPLPNDLPIYEDFSASLSSIRKISEIQGIDFFLSSWEDPVQGHEVIQKRIKDGEHYLHRIHEAVKKVRSQGVNDLMELCRGVIADIGLPPFAVNPLVARSFASNLSMIDHTVNCCRYDQVRDLSQNRQA